MADFKITGTVWLHNRPWKPGSEDRLQEAGFSAGQKREQAERGMIVRSAKPQAAPAVAPAKKSAKKRAKKAK